MTGFSWHATVAGLIEALAPHPSPLGLPDDDLLALGREIAACAAAEEITADARFAADQRRRRG
jgi:hypothetical protein